MIHVLRLQKGSRPSPLCTLDLGIVYRTLKHGWVFSDFPNFVLVEH